MQGLACRSFWVGGSGLWQRLTLPSRLGSPWVASRLCRDLTALSDFVGDEAFFLSDRPTTLDASTFGLLSTL